MPFVPKRDSKQIYMPATLEMPLYFFMFLNYLLPIERGWKDIFR